MSLGPCRAPRRRPKGHSTRLVIAKRAIPRASTSSSRDSSSRPCHAMTRQCQPAMASASSLSPEPCRLRTASSLSGPCQLVTRELLGSTTQRDCWTRGSRAWALLFSLMSSSSHVPQNEARRDQQRDSRRLSCNDPPTATTNSNRSNESIDRQGQIDRDRPRRIDRDQDRPRRNSTVLASGIARVGSLLQCDSTIRRAPSIPGLHCPPPYHIGTAFFITPF